MTSAFSLARNSIPLDFSRATGHELKDVFTQALAPDRNGNPTVYKGTLYHNGEQYLVTRFYEMVGSQSLEKHVFSRQVDFEQPWPKVIADLFLVFVVGKTWIGKRQLENVRREFEVLLKTRKNETRSVPLDHVLSINKGAEPTSVRMRKLADEIVDLRACRETDRSIHPARRLDEAGYTGDATMGALVKGGFQQPPCRPYSEARDTDALYVFELRDGTTRVTVEARLMNGSATSTLADAAGRYQRLSEEIRRLKLELTEIKSKQKSLGEAGVDASPRESVGAAQEAKNLRRQIDGKKNHMARVGIYAGLSKEIQGLELKLRAIESRQESLREAGVDALSRESVRAEQEAKNLRRQIDGKTNRLRTKPSLTNPDEICTRLRNEIMTLESKLTKIDAIAEAHEISERTKIERITKAHDIPKQIAIMEEEMLHLAEIVRPEAGKLVTRLHEKEVEHGGWNLQQRRLFNAAVDQLWMMLDISPATSECPTNLTRGTAEEKAEKKILAQQFRKLYSLPDAPLRRNTQDINTESRKLIATLEPLRTDPCTRRVIAELLSEDGVLTAGMEREEIADVFDFFINTPLAL